MCVERLFSYDVHTSAKKAQVRVAGSSFPMLTGGNYDWQPKYNEKLQGTLEHKSVKYPRKSPSSKLQHASPLKLILSDGNCTRHESYAPRRLSSDDHPLITNVRGINLFMARQVVDFGQNFTVNDISFALCTQIILSKSFDSIHVCPE